MTITQTFYATIKGLERVCNQLYDRKTDSISYTVNGKHYEHEAFWKLRPVIA